MKIFAGLFLLVALPAQAAEMLLYQLIEPGVGASPSRIIVTDKFVRMDDNIDGGDFALFDRKARTLYSVVHEDRSIFTIPARDDDGIQPPLKLQRGEALVPADLPAIAGRTPKHHRLSVNGAVCHNVIAIDGVMEESVKALREMQAVLAGEQRKALPHTPADMQDPCGMALHAFHPDWALSFGLPVQEWGVDGRGRQLMDFRGDFAVKPELFELPEGYGRYSSGE